MACNRPELADYLTNFTGQDPVNAVVCAYSQSGGGGMGMGVTFTMFVFAFMGLALSIRAQHPGPIMVAGILSAGLMAASLPGIVLKIFALVMVFGIAAVGLYLYQNAQSSL